MKNKKVLFSSIIALSFLLFAGSAQAFSLNSFNSLHSLKGDDSIEAQASGSVNAGVSSDDKDKKGDMDADDQRNSQHTRHIMVVTAINGNVIVGTNALSNNGTERVITDSNTTFVDRIGATSSIDSIQVGDTVSIHGMISNGMATASGNNPLIVHAYRVRDWGDVNIQNKDSLKGQIVSIDDSNYQLVLATQDGKQITVNASPLTKVGTGTSTHSTFSQLAEGMTIQVKGFWNSMMDVITAIKIRFQ